MDKDKEQERAARADVGSHRIMPSPKDIFGTKMSGRSTSNFKTDIRVDAPDAQALSKKISSSSTMSTRTGLSELEGHALSKARLIPTHVETVARKRDPMLRSSTSSAKTSKKSFPAAVTETKTLRDLDERIAHKTGITTENQRREPTPPQDEKHGTLSPKTAEVGLSVRESLAKLTGLPIDAIGAALQKNGQGSALEQKLGAETGYPSTDVEVAEDCATRLAVAVAVKEDDDHKFIPAAIEYDPEAKPPIYRNRRFRLYSLVACTLTVVMIAGVIGLQVVHNKQENATIGGPTEAPKRPGSKGILEQLELTVGSEKLQDPQGPHYRAKEWLINEDPLQLSPNDANLVQRYLLAVIYFKFHAEGEWLSCDAPTQEEPEDFCLFQKLINIFPKEYRSVSSYKWLSGNHECSWAGLYCDEFFQLRSIDLTAQDISAELPIEFTSFPFLQGISLSWNKFRGTLPIEYGDMPHLLNFEMHYNELTGGIPKEWTRAKNLQLFNLAANLISGTIPKEFGDMVNLKGVFLYENMLSGTFPSEIGQLSLLSKCHAISNEVLENSDLSPAYARLQRNFLSGTIPTEVGLLAPREFWSHSMPLVGRLPSEIGAMQGILDLRLQNTSISGTIPDELWQLSQLFRLDLYNTKISGTLSPKVAQLSDLVFLRLHHAEFTGTLPSALANMTQLTKVRLDGNKFVGSVPEGLCFQDKIDEFVADCLPSSATGVAQIDCECCTLCCDPATGICN